MRTYKRGRIWWCRYFDASANIWRRVSTHLTDKGAADAHGRRLERDGADPDGAAAASATIATALDAVIAEYEALVAEGRKAAPTLAFYRKRAGQVLRMVSERLLPARLSELRARHVDMMIDFRRLEGTSRATIAKDLIVLRLALKLAKRRGQWTGDVDAVLPHRFGADYKPVERWLRPAELAALVATMKTARGAWLFFAVATGANMSEAQRARRGDVGSSSVHLRGTKRERRDRHVPIVYPWQRALLDAALSAAGPDRLFAPWVKMGRDVHIACERAGVARCSSNDLRRTFGTWARAEGARLEDLAPAMGHADTRMLERVYARLDVEQVAALLRSTVPPLYRTPSHSAPQAHSAHAAVVSFPAESGSDCWTRTSDPVINRRQDEVALLAENGPGFDYDCAAGVHEFPGLAKGRVMLGLWDVVERYAAGLAEGG